MKDPEPYLRHLGIGLSCPVEAGARAVMDGRHRAYVNHEIFLLSSDAALRKFVKDPLRYCGIVTDPVSGERFRPGRRSPRLDHEKRPYFFKAAGTRDAFEKTPAEFANPKRRMPAQEAAASQPASAPSAPSAR